MQKQDQLEKLLEMIGYDLWELKKELALEKSYLEAHIKEFNAHKEPIQLPRWMQQETDYTPNKCKCKECNNPANAPYDYCEECWRSCKLHVAAFYERN